MRTSLPLKMATTWAAVIAKATVLSMSATDATKQCLATLGASTLALVGQDEKSLPKQCKIAPDLMQYRRAIAGLKLLQGLPMADTALAIVQSGKAAITEQLYNHIREGLIAGKMDTAAWLTLFDSVY